MLHWWASGGESRSVEELKRLLAAQLAASRELVAPVFVGTLCAFVGAFVGKRLLKKVTLRAVQLTVAMAMPLIGGALLART